MWISQAMSATGLPTQRAVHPARLTRPVVPTIAVKRLAKDGSFDIGDGYLPRSSGVERLEGRISGVAPIDEKWGEVTVVTDRDPPAAKQDLG
jgi:hypothetical protein